MRIKWRNPKTSKAQKILRISTWVLAISVLIPYLVFSFSYPYVTSDCSYETGLCPLHQSIALDIAMVSFRVSYYAWWILAPLALLTGLADAAIAVVRQVKNS